MKRSEVNAIIRESDAFIRSFGYIMPPFAYWSPEQMQANAKGGSGILNGRMGWDITDYGQGKFEELGLFLFTVRNGVAADLARGRGMAAVRSLRNWRAATSSKGSVGAPCERNSGRIM